ncbi:hypothetical protein, partial [uncultured Vibrio sp.]|uniref:hypothetical protein n=1 Tax=uncultured Vibrio sp. TaxID=114054 RepID=UPI002635190A
ELDEETEIEDSTHHVSSESDNVTEPHIEPSNELDEETENEISINDTLRQPPKKKVNIPNKTNIKANFDEKFKD